MNIESLKAIWHDKHRKMQDLYRHARTSKIPISIDAIEREHGKILAALRKGLYDGTNQ